YHGPDRSERGQVPPGGAGLARASGRVILRIEEQHDRLAAEIPKADRDAVLVRPLEVGSEGARLELVGHRRLRTVRAISRIARLRPRQPRWPNQAESLAQSFRISRAALHTRAPAIPPPGRPPDPH